VSGKPTLLVEGWRFLPHSYAIVNQWQLLALARRGDIDLKIRDTPYPYEGWKAARGIFPARDEAALDALNRAEDGENFDITYRIGFPYDFRLAPSERTAVFLTSEYQNIAPAYFAGSPDFAALRKDPRFAIVTPSNWSARACRDLGFPDQQIAVIPHGVETALFRPDAEGRASARRHLGLEGFVFFNNGAMTPNKGIDLLLKAFAIVAGRHSHARLILKGLDPLYDSRNTLQRNLGALTSAEREAIQGKIVFVGAALGMKEMAALYQASDAYVSPYRAEGFNMPVLEAAASGLPIICTAGGPTDDFVTGDFARPIESRVEEVEYNGLPGRHLVPDFEHLVSLMREAMENRVWQGEAARTGPLHTHLRYGWDRVVDSLLRALGA
jgi:glycosyltransferase involved in cell wall biosynthesis